MKKRLKFEWFCEKTGNCTQWVIPCDGCDRSCDNLRKVSPSRGIFGRVKQKVFNRYGDKCIKCGSSKRMTIDHIIPISKGGTNDESNLQPMCFDCNTEKGNRSSIDYRSQANQTKTT